jgi:hypothetical protein
MKYLNWLGAAVLFIISLPILLLIGGKDILKKDDRFQDVVSKDEELKKQIIKKKQEIEDLTVEDDWFRKSGKA